MKIAITGAAGRLGCLLTPYLRADHEVFASDIRPVGPMLRADVCDPEAMASLCSGMDAVIHLAAARRDDHAGDSETSSRILDSRLKGTYNVLHAAMHAGVKRVVQISDICVYTGYHADLIVSEDFLPLPDTSAYQQSVYLSELVGREFARLSPGLVLTIRLGMVIEATNLPVTAPLDESWIDTQDALAGITRSLEIDHYDGMGHWGLYNLVGDIDNGRYSIHKIKTGHFGFHPSESFSAWQKRDRV